MSKSQCSTTSRPASGRISSHGSIGSSCSRGASPTPIAARARSAGAVAGPPLFGFDVPEQSAFEDSDRVVIRGAVCSDAPVELAEPIENTRCDGDLNLVVLDIRLEGEGTRSSREA